jgi:hypothetical protein
MVLYLLLCLVSVFAGAGILTLIGLEVDRSSTLALTPVVTLCSLVIFMGGLVAGGFTVGQITPWAYALCLGAAILGAIRHGKIVLSSWRALLMLAGLPLLILMPSLLEGFANYSGGICLDGWAYVTNGQSLQQYPLGAEGWLPPAVQFTSQFGKATRFMTYGFLGLLAPLSGVQNDTQDVFGRYVGWLFFVYGCACLFFAKAARLTRPLTWMFVFLAMLSGWTFKLVNANSVDNTLALCFLPAVLGILMLIPRPSRRYGILLGVVVSASCYSYPESAPFTVAALLAMTAERLLAAPRLLREFGRMSLAFLIAMAICLSPYALGIVDYYKFAVTAATQPLGVRPGENFYRLLLDRHYFLPSYWGLTPDFFGQRYSGLFDPLAQVTSWILTLAAVAGGFLLLRRKCWSLPLFVAGMTAAYIICLVRLRYPYAAYKIIVLSWFGIAYLAVAALAWISERLGRRSSMWLSAGIGLGYVLLATVGGFFLLQEKIFYDSLPFHSVREFRKISLLENLTRDRPVAMFVKETYANVWATHFLRHSKLYLAEQYRGSMAPYAMSRSEPVDFEEMRYVVTDDETLFNKEFLLSREGPYYVWDLRQNPWIILMEIDSPVGLPLQGGADSSLWIAKVYTELRILSRTATSVTVSGEFTIKGGAPANARQNIHIATSGGYRADFPISNGRNSFSAPLLPGINKLVVRSAEKAPLLIHVDHLTVSTPTDVFRELNAASEAVAHPLPNRRGSVAVPPHVSEPSYANNHDAASRK